MTFEVLVATWGDGAWALAGETRTHELAGRSVAGLTVCSDGRVLAIGDGHSLIERTAPGLWQTLAVSGHALSCLVAVGERLYAGTDDAKILRLADGGELVPVEGFDAVPGRASWYAGTAIIDGRQVGPPLGVRSMSATADRAALLANVHVGGIPRTCDGGETWAPTLDIDWDVHEVRAHPTQPRLVIAAAAAGLCVSEDGGESWSLETAGLHATYCSAVAFCGDSLFVAAAEHHFAARGALYARRLDDRGPLRRVAGGLPEWLDGIVDTAGIAANERELAIVARGGRLHASGDGGETWSLRGTGLPGASSVALVPNARSRERAAAR